jgi:hypothetical protein
MSVIIISNASGGSGMVDSVTAGDLSIVVGGTASNPTVETGTLDEIATLHPPAGNWSNNSKKITALANGSGAQDAAAFGQIGTAVAVETARAEAAEALLVPLSDLPLSIANGGTGQATAVAGFNALNPNTAPAVFTPADPTGTTSTTQVMMGIGATYTPSSSGLVQAVLSCGYGSLTGQTNQKITGQYGTGSAPANGAAVTGTRWGTGEVLQWKVGGGTSAGDVNALSLTDILTLTPGTTYWFDVALATTTGADQGFVQGIKLILVELPAGSTGGTAVATPVPISVGGTGQSTAAAALAALGGLPLAGGTMSGAIAMGSNKITGLANGSGTQDAAAFGQIPVNDPFALGFTGTTIPGVSASSSTVQSSNNGWYLRCLSAGYAMSHIAVDVVTSSGNACVAAYEGNGSSGAANAPATQYQTSGSVACPAAGHAVIALGGSCTPVITDWLALAADNATAVFYENSGVPSAMGAGYAASQGSAFPLPSTPSSLTSSAGRQFIMKGS